MRPVFCKSKVVGWRVYTRDGVFGNLRFYGYEWL